MKTVLLALLLVACGGSNDIATFTEHNPDGSTTKCHTWEFDGKTNTECTTFK